MCFNGINVRKINTTFTVAAAAFFCRQAFIYHAAYIKQCGGKQYKNYNYLEIHVTNLIHFTLYIRKDKANSIGFTFCFTHAKYCMGTLPKYFTFDSR
jgi:hypothetical protein